jgi:peptidoglycan/xylan/chitin deacetylase (PgdA/CDA1 family)
VKSTVEAVLVRGGFANLSRHLHRDRTLVLAYHNIVPHGEPATGDRSLHLPARDFSEHLDLLLRHCDVTPLDSVFESRTEGKRPTVAITFDDAYRGTVTAGVNELVMRGLPATIFVVPAFVGGNSFWWDAVLPAAEDKRNGFREWALDALRGRDQEIRAWAKSQAVHSLQPPPHAVTATEEELRTAATQPGITFGSHTWSHPNLTQLDADSVEEELVSPLEWLRQRFEPVVPWLTYPYGLASPTVERAAAAAGYRGAFSVTGSWLPKTNAAAFALPRLNIPAGVTPNGFILRLSGFPGR